MMRSFLPLLRGFSSRYSKRVAGCLLAAAGTTTAAYAFTVANNKPVGQFAFRFPLMTQCAAKVFPQSSVINPVKDHSLFLTIHLRPGCTAQECLKELGNMQKYIDNISPPDLRDESDEIWYGVGFGSKFLNELGTDYQPAGIVSYTYRTRSGPHGDLPNTGGDIFIHAKCNERGKLFELCQAIMNHMPHGCVAKFEDVYGWTYRGGRDLTGFMDGTENPADEDDRIEAAIDPKTGGSYVVTQKWIHNHPVIRATKDGVKEQYIGRDLKDSVELRKKPDTSHVARMVGSADFDATPKFQIVRHSQPWGTVSGDSGLFFIGYSATPVALDFMLDRMTGLGEDKKADDLMRLTQCVTGNYWFFPSKPHLDKMIGKAGSGSSFRLWR
ncbi:hypothetical protein EG68_03578 [Paragonimus skrjabini miyazakii]|uniref:Deferrochelatase/peroxidase YfeX n=1 Tax=Paragonimus skrjabini miyazakii TaxID=59628 RepID=A0A8S9YYV2_9TREM|nr:hypothetical protein EG68_03578 [Paragonimus skrjabini miyazakii]